MELQTKGQLLNLARLADDGLHVSNVGNPFGTSATSIGTGRRFVNLPSLSQDFELIWPLDLDLGLTVLFGGFEGGDAAIDPILIGIL